MPDEVAERRHHDHKADDVEHEQQPQHRPAPAAAPLDMPQLLALAEHLGRKVWRADASGVLRPIVPDGPLPPVDWRALLERR